MVPSACSLATADDATSHNFPEGIADRTKQDDLTRWRMQ